DVADDARRLHVVPRLRIDGAFVELAASEFDTVEFDVMARTPSSRTGGAIVDGAYAEREDLEPFEIVGLPAERVELECRLSSLGCEDVSKWTGAYDYVHLERDMEPIVVDLVAGDATV